MQAALHSYQARLLCCLHKTLHRFDETPHCSAPVSFYGPVVRCPAEVCTPPLHPLTLLPSSSSQPQGEPQYSFVSTSEAGVMGT